LASVGSAGLLLFNGCSTVAFPQESRKIENVPHFNRKAFIAGRGTWFSGRFDASVAVVPMLILATKGRR
jgi:hypothetical protein